MHTQYKVKEINAKKQQLMKSQCSINSSATGRV